MVLARSKVGFDDGTLRLSAFLANSREQIRFLHQRLRLYGRRQMEGFATSAFPRVFLELRPQRLLAGVRTECVNLGFQIVANFDDGGGWRQSHGLASGQTDVGAGMVQLLNPVRVDRAVQLIRKAIASPRPMECEGSEDRCHRMIGVARNSTRWIKREQDLGTKFADAQG